MKQQKFSNVRYAELKEIKYYETNEEFTEDNILKDSYEVLDKNKESIKIKYIRKVSISKKFVLEIITEIIRKPYSVKTGFKEEILEDDYINQNINYFLGLAPSFASSLISDITSAFTNIPFITPPMFFKN